MHPFGLNNIPHRPSQQVRSFLLVLFFCGGMATAKNDIISELRTLESAIASNRAEAVTLEKEAHMLLDAARYDEAVSTHRRSQTLLADAQAARNRLGARRQELIKQFIEQLDAGDFKEREQASKVLAMLGAAALPQLRKVVEDNEDPEVTFRVRELLQRSSNLSFDEEGRMQQWATSAKSSTQYSVISWSAKQATGKPNTPKAGDHVTAWAPSTAGAGPEWLELSYKEPVRIHAVDVIETYNPGAVVGLEARDLDGAWHILWEGVAPVVAAPRSFRINVPADKRFMTKRIRLSLDTTKVPGYNEIDAVRLVGEMVP